MSSTPDARAGAVAAVAAQQRQPQPAAPVIDEIMGFHALSSAEQRRADHAMANELAYQFTAPMRQAVAPGDAEALAALNRLAVIDDADQARIFAQADEVARCALLPFAHTLLRMNGLDPATADAEAARTVLSKSLSREEAEALQRAYSKALDELFEPQLRELLDEAGVQLGTRDQGEVLRELQAAGRQYKRSKSSSSAGSGGLLAALLGTLAAVGATQLLQWVQRARRRRRQGDSSPSGSATPASSAHSACLEEDIGSSDSYQ